MSYLRPFHRTFRPVSEKQKNHGYSSWAYIIDKEYSQCPEHFTRAFFLIQGDLMKLFEYIEPADTNLNTYSYRIHELFMRTCIEIESNLKAILRENIFTPVYKAGNNKGNMRVENDWNINDYYKINRSHFLSQYSVEIPIWKGNSSRIFPFKEWENSPNLIWYRSYNDSKHDRNINFEKASFSNLLFAITGLLVVLSSQFNRESFNPGSTLLNIGTAYSYYKGEFGIGNFFIINFPKFSEEIKYDFNWEKLSKEKKKFDKIDFNNL